MIDLKQLITWLGTEGAKAGLDKSDLTNSDLIEMFSSILPKNSAKTKRAELIDIIVSQQRKEMVKKPDELMEMDADSLKEYFHSIKVSRAEILELLESLDIRPGSIARKNIMEFAVREITDIGMYQRVAKGHLHNN